MYSIATDIVAASHNDAFARMSTGACHVEQPPSHRHHRQSQKATHTHTHRLHLVKLSMLHRLAVSAGHQHFSNDITGRTSCRVFIYNHLDVLIHTPLCGMMSHTPRMCDRLCLAAFTLTFRVARRVAWLACRAASTKIARVPHAKAGGGVAKKSTYSTWSRLCLSFSLRLLPRARCLC